MIPTDDEWRERFEKMTPVPFPESLAEQIRIRAKEQSPVAAKTARRKSFWKNIGVASAGVAVAGIIMAGVFPFKKVENLPTQNSTMYSSASSTAQNENQSKTLISAAQGFGLQAAQLNMGTVQVGSGPAWQPNSYVSTTLQNIGTQPISNQNTFGILYFTPKGSTASSWMQSDSATFVNVLDSPTQKAINPGQVVSWYFHPVGAPHAKDGSLTQTPHLVFFQTGLVSQAKADQFWASPQVDTQVLSVTPTMWANHQGQNVDVKVSLTNKSNAPVKLSSLWFIIWFGQTPSQDFTEPSAVRFLDYAPAAQQGEVLPPGGQLTMDLKEVGAATTNFSSLTPHVAAVSR